MIKKYKQYNEGIKHLLVGPTEDEVTEYWLSIDELSPDELLKKSVVLGVLKGVKIAIEKGADVHYENDLLLVMASSKGHYNIVEYGLSLGLNRRINSALKSACQRNHIDIVGLLLDNGADIHIDNEYCLKIAVQYYYFELTKFLLKRGADIHATNDWVIKVVNDGRKSGYTKFKNLFNKILSTNEGIRHLLVGPTKEEVWKNKGYSDIMKTPPDTAKEFLEMILDDITIVNQRKYRASVFYKRNGEIYFELEYNNQILWVNYSKVWLVLVNYYGLTGWDLTNLINKITHKKLRWPIFEIKESDRLPHGFWEGVYELGEKNDRELNEGIKHLLVGPTKEEVIDNLNDKYEKDQIDMGELVILCIKSNFVDLIEEIIELNEFDDYNLQFVLTYAIVYKSIDIIELVLSYGLKKNLVEEVEIYNDTPIEIKNIIKNYLEQ